MIVNKNLVKFEEDEKRFQLSNKYWICNKLFHLRDNKVSDQCYITGKYRGYAHWSCNINLKLTNKVPVIFDNLGGYDSHLIMQNIDKFDVKVSVIPNESEKYMAFTINKNLAFIDSMQFMNSSLEILVKDLSDNDFNHLSQQFNGELLEFRDQNNRFSNTRQNVLYYKIFNGHFKNPSDIISACLGSRVQAPPTCLPAKIYYDNFWRASIFLL